MIFLDVHGVSVRINSSDNFELFVKNSLPYFFVDDKNHPWYGNLFVAGLRGRHLHRFVIDDNKLIQDEIFYLSKKTEKGILHPRIRDVEFYNGSIWILSDVFGVAKLTPN